MALRRGRVVTRSTPRTSSWVGVDLAPVDVSANSAILVGSLNAAALLLRPFTITRTRMDVLWSSDQNVAGEEPFGSMGCIVVSDTAAALGITAIPDPVSSPEGNWFVYQPLQAKFLFITAAGFESDAGHHITVDSKAMRRVGADEDIAIVCGNSAAAHGGRIAIQGRMLFKLH